MDRRIKLETIGNCRDLGGLRGADGKTVRPGLLLRAAMLGHASDDDLRVLRDEHRLDTVIDLRTITESDQRPDRLIDGIGLIHIPVLDERAAGVTHERTTTPRELRPILPYDMCGMYRTIVGGEAERKNLARAMTAVLGHDFARGAVLWHCSEGKDRCGLVAALSLGALGVSREDIFEDYLMTNEVNLPKAQGYYDRVLAVGRTVAEAEIIRDVYLAKAEYLEAAMEVVEGQYGGVVPYLLNGLGLSQQLLSDFRASALD